MVNTEVKSRTDKEQYYIGSDDYGLHKMTTIIAPGLTASGRDICRRPEFPPDFSILIKFAMSDSDPAIFNFLNITNQLAITLDRCSGADDSLVISFPGCQLNTMKFPLKVVSNKFHKIGIRFTNSNVAVSLWLRLRRLNAPCSVMSLWTFIFCSHKLLPPAVSTLKRYVGVSLQKVTAQCTSSGQDLHSTC